MAATYDNSVGTSNFGVTSLTTGSFTIGSGSNRAALVGLCALADPGAISSVTVGGVGGSTTPIATGNDAYNWLRIFLVIAPGTGSQTAAVAWTNSVTASLGCVTATGVDQTTGANNGNYAQAAANNVSVNATSAAGDLTVSVSGNDSASTGATSNQTKVLSLYGSMDYGPGTANPTHTWTSVGSFNTNAAVANFIAAAAGGGLSIPVAMAQQRFRRN